MAALAGLAAGRLNFYVDLKDSELDDLFLGFNIPIIVSGFLLVIGGFVGATRTSYRGTYLTLLFSALLITAYPMLIIFTYYSGMLIEYDIGSYFEALSTMPMWWLLFITLHHLSAPRLAHEESTRSKYQKILYGTNSSSFVMIVTSAALSGEHSNYESSILVYNISIVMYYILFLVWMNMGPLYFYKDVIPLGRSFKLFRAILVFHFIGNIVSIILFGLRIGGTVDPEYPDILFILGPFIMNDIPVILALTVFLISFPRYWLPHIRETEIQYGEINQVETSISSDDQKQDNMTTRANNRRASEDEEEAEFTSASYLMLDDPDHSRHERQQDNSH